MPALAPKQLPLMSSQGSLIFDRAKEQAERFFGLVDCLPSKLAQLGGNFQLGFSH
jgi:hypothetical protein